MLNGMGSFVRRLHREPEANRDPESPEVMAQQLDHAMRAGKYNKYMVIVQRDQQLYQSNGALAEEQREALDKLIRIKPLVDLILGYAIIPRQRVYDVAIDGQNALVRMVFKYVNPDVTPVRNITTYKYRIVIDLIERGMTIKEEDCIEEDHKQFGKPTSHVNSLKFWKAQLGDEKKAIFGRMAFWS